MSGCHMATYDLDAALPWDCSVAFDGAFSSVVVGLSFMALISRKWYKTIRSIAKEPRNMAREYRSLSEIIVKHNSYSQASARVWKGRVRGEVFFGMTYHSSLTNFEHC